MGMKMRWDARRRGMLMLDDTHTQCKYCLMCMLFVDHRRQIEPSRVKFSLLASD